MAIHKQLCDIPSTSSKTSSCVSFSLCFYRCFVEPVLLWCSEDANHPGRPCSSDKQRHHTPLQLGLLPYSPWRPQASPPHFPGAAQCYGLPQVKITRAYKRFEISLTEVHSTLPPHFQIIQHTSVYLFLYNETNWIVRQWQSFILSENECSLLLNHPCCVVLNAYIPNYKQYCVHSLVSSHSLPLSLFSLTNFSLVTIATTPPVV